MHLRMQSIMLSHLITIIYYSNILSPPSHYLPSHVALFTDTFCNDGILLPQLMLCMINKPLHRGEAGVQDYKTNWNYGRHMHPSKASPTALSVTHSFPVASSPQ